MNIWSKFNLAYLNLVAYYILIVMAISISFSVVIYSISSSEINRGIGRQEMFMSGMPFSDFEQYRTSQLQESNTHLRVNLIYANLIILLLTGILGYFVAKRNMQPFEEVMELQQRFIADASHELKTPLTAMRSEIEVVLRDNKITQADAKRILQSNLEEIEKLQYLAESLLQLARVENKVEIKREKLDLSNIVVSAYQKIESVANEKELRFNNSFDSAVVRGDEGKLVELFTILLDNAVKYSPRKSNIEIAVKQIKNGSMVSIKDHGIGIKQSDLPYIFNRFYRVDQSRNKEKSNGYGLGLSIAKEIAESFGGKITVKSVAGKGSEFIVQFA
ncbi:MAG: HAMP domain-containing sensor histidine kinase [Candidatus Berkelbacteria bacterium]